MKIQKEKFSQKLFCLFTIIVLFLLFLFIGENGPVLQPDSSGYITMSPSREMLYPCFLLLLRTFFGDNHYMMVAVVTQCLFASVSVFLLTEELKKRLHFGSMIGLIGYLCLALPFFLSPMWGSKPHNYAHLILTEGITYSLFYFILFLFIRAWFEPKIKTICVFAVGCIMIALSRSQMMIFIPFIVILFIHWKKTFIKGFLLGSISMLLLFFFISLTGKVYIFCRTGFFTGSSENSITILTNAIYSSDREDAEDIDDLETRALFLNVYDRAYENEANYAWSDKDLFGRMQHVSWSHDQIKGDILREEIVAYLEKTGYESIDTDFQSNQIIENVCTKLSKMLIKKHFPRWLGDRICQFILGLIYSTMCIFPDKYIALCLTGTVIFILLFIILLFRNRKKSGFLVIGLSQFMLMIMNTAGIALVIFPTMRYCDFIWGIMYFIFILLLIQSIKKEDRSLNVRNSRNHSIS